MWEGIVPFTIGFLLATVIFWRPSFGFQIRFLRGEITRLLDEAKERERRSAELRRQLRADGEGWKIAENPPTPPAPRYIKERSDKPMRRDPPVWPN